MLPLNGNFINENHLKYDGGKHPKITTCYPAKRHSHANKFKYLKH